MTTIPDSFSGAPDYVVTRAGREPAGLEGASRLLAVCFWTAFVITVVIGASLVAVTTSSQLLSSLCGSGCHAGYVINAMLRRVVLVGEPVLVVASMVGWALARRTPRTAGTVIYAVVFTFQLALTGWILFAAYQLFAHH
jgi:hypothetical protein